MQADRHTDTLIAILCTLPGTKYDIERLHVMGKIKHLHITSEHNHVVDSFHTLSEYKVRRQYNNKVSP